MPLLVDSNFVITKAMVNGTSVTVLTSMENLISEVQNMVDGTSTKFVPEPESEAILGDLLIGLKRFKNSARLKEFWRNQNQTKLQSEANNEFSQTGYMTGMKDPNYSPPAPKGSKELECFLQTLERELLTLALDVKSTKLNNTSKRIGDIMNKLKKFPSLVIVPTDKTNSYRSMEIDKYEKLVVQHLIESGEEISRSRLIEIHDKGMDLLERLKKTMTKNEYFTIRSQISSKTIPTPSLLIKDHKKIDKSGFYPTRLLCPASNFTSCFSKLGYLGIKRIFDSNEIDYEKRNIKQASDLKSKLEELQIKKGDTSILTFDAEAMYPSIKLDLVIKAVKYFSRNLKKTEKVKIKIV